LEGRAAVMEDIADQCLQPEPWVSKTSLNTGKKIGIMNKGGCFVAGCVDGLNRKIRFQGPRTK